jgi:hypothetical protein
MTNLWLFRDFWLTRAKRLVVFYIGLSPFWLTADGFQKK